MSQTLFTSKKDEWETPQELFEQLHQKFLFTLDPCCDESNAKCEQYFTKEDDGLIQSWAGHRVFMNPPYGRSIGKWMQKAYEEFLNGTTVVCLVPARTDTIWWHEYATKGQIIFLRGRLKFGGSKNSAPFPSAIVVFQPQNILIRWAIRYRLINNFHRRIVL